jgi:hypothetical protein
VTAPNIFDLTRSGSGPVGAACGAGL